MERQESVMKTFVELFKEVKDLEGNMNAYWRQWGPSELMEMQGIERFSHKTEDEMDIDDLFEKARELTELEDDVIDDMYKDLVIQEKL